MSLDIQVENTFQLVTFAAILLALSAMLSVHIAHVVRHSL